MSERSIPGNVTDHTALLKQALRTIEQMKQKLEEARQRDRQPVAVIGIGCRFPGGVQDPESFWQLLKHGREAISEVPADRWNIDAYYDPDPSKVGKMVSRFGGFLTDIDRFDAAFFGIAPREAAMIDPQQRMLLETAWETLERAGIAPRSLAGSCTGIYLGIASGDYAQLQLNAGDAGLLDVHYASGNAHSVASGRLSYLLGLKGPSLSIDTACSSSLVAVHLACQALRSGECTLAIAGGVNLILAPQTTVALSHAHMMSPDGRSKAFDDRADGFARAEGCGIVLLKPLAQAQADGDRILAVIRGTAVNQDGASSSLTAPNGPSQEELMRHALDNAGRTAAQVGYVEAHGTGTSLGDPIELRALGAIYGAGRKPEEPSLLVGSLKTNFGHMEAAAGVGGLIKLILAIENGEIPAHLQFKTPTTHVPWSQLRLAVPVTTMSWPDIRDDKGRPAPRLGAVSSFGFSGTNAHLVVEQAPALMVPRQDECDERTLVFPLSAASGEALRALAERYAGWLSSPSSQSYTWPEIALTAATGRNALRYRTALAAGSKAEAVPALRRFLSAPFPENIGVSPSLCFLFTGQGSEHSGMGLELLRMSDIFRKAIARLDNAIADQLPSGIAAIWTSEHRELERSSFVQPALYAYGWALSELWRSWGIEPSVVLGHSLGEYIAATVAGVMTPEEGICLVAARGRLTEALGDPGAMIAVVAAEEEVRRLLASSSLTDDLSIAAVNGPESTVISGRLEPMRRFEDALPQSGLRHKRLRTTHGFHSAALDGMLDAFEAEAAKISFRPPEIRWVSNLTGQAVERKQPVNAKYWRQHLRHTVQFRQGLVFARDTGANLFLELGTEPQLLALAEANGISGAQRIASMAKGGTDGEWRKLLTATSQLYAQGIDPDWKAVLAGVTGRRVPLPTYPFQRQRYWFTDHRSTSTTSSTISVASRPTSGHPLLGSRLRTRSEAVLFHGELTPSSPAHLGDHVVMGRRVLPAAAYLEMALAAARQLEKDTHWKLSDVEFREICVFDQPRLLETVITVIEPATGRRQVEIASSALKNSDTGAASEQVWTLHATGFLEPFSSELRNTATVDLPVMQSRSEIHWEKDAFYDRFRAVGLDFGPSFQSVEYAWGSAGESLVALCNELPTPDHPPQYRIHSVALDACLQAAAALADSGTSFTPALPAALRSFELSGNPADLRYACSVVRSRQGRALTVDIRGLDAQGHTVCFLEGLTLVEVRQEPHRGWLHEIAWEQIVLPEAESEDSAAWIVPEVRVSLNLPLLQDEITALAHRNNLPEVDRWMVEFDLLCAAWIAENVEQGGFVLTSGREFHIADLFATLAVAPQHERLARRFVDILREAGYLEQMDENHFRVLTKARVDAESFAVGLRAANHAEMAWTERTVSQLLPLLRGEVKPVDALFSGDGRAIATRLYRESVAARTLNPLVAAAAVQAASRLQGRARILEVGGGTAATTSYLAPALSGQMQEYLWTDLGAGFVSAARREFGTVPCMRFQTLDLERDPAEQGVAAQTFHIVIASNVVHATADLRQTLRHIRSVMAPGGVLLMVETLGKQPWIDLTVGFTEGWWRYTDTDIRPHYTLTGKPEWRRVLDESGFGGVQFVPDQEDGLLSRQCLIAAVSESLHAQAETKHCEPSANSQLLILTAQGVAADKNRSVSFAESLAKVARGSQASVALIPASDATPAMVERWFAEAPNTPRDKRHIVYLPAVEIAAPADSGSDVLKWQDIVLGGALQWTQAMLSTDRIADCRLWFVSRGAAGPEISSPHGASLAAFVRSLRAEYPQAQAAAVDLPSGEETQDQVARQLWRLCLSSSAPSSHYVVRGLGIWTPHLFRLALSSSETGARSANLLAIDGFRTRRLHLPDTGLLEDLKTVSEERRPPAENEVEIAVRATAINFHEVLSALSTESDHDIAPGGECAGVVVRVGSGVPDFQPGDEVVAIGTGLMADFATLPQDRIWKKPGRLSLEEAATLPIPFLTARWSLDRVARLQPGERILIHAAAGGVGLAAIQEAQRLGAVVYATAGSEAKREYLHGLGLEGVFDSRSIAFETEVLKATGFRGVDVVLNSLAGDKIAGGLRTLARHGRFIELGEQTVLTDSEVKAHRPDVSYHRVHLRAALAEMTPEADALLGSVFRDAEAGLLKPLPWKRFDLQNPAEAFRFMATAQHIGRVLLGSAFSSDRFTFRRDGAYIVTGGFSGLGRLVVEWLARQGVGCVLALARSQPDAETQTLFSDLQDSGTAIVALRCDVSDSAALARAIQAIPSCFVLRGVFHAAGALDDAALPQQTLQRFNNVLAAKVAGAWNLHQLTQTTPLDCFVLFSSAAGVLGSRGQANHAAGNAWMDALAHYRRERLKQTALSINWGAWSGTGAAVRHNVVERSERAGIAAIPPADGLSILRRLIEEDRTQVLVSGVNWEMWSEHATAEAAANADLLSRVLFSPLPADAEPSLHSHSVHVGGAVQDSWKALLLGASAMRQFSILEARVEERIRAVLSLPATEALEGGRPLQEYGLDSLLSIELRNALSADLEVKLPATTLFDYPTLVSLTKWLFHDVLDLRFGGEAVNQPPEPAKKQDAVEGIASLSDEEVERLFQQKMAEIHQ
jgi:acyl transferase domain-containing protein/NADPH:quinone reductase-like Zn-dependent oxidoreductase/NAD(P)-dependent dehydrogenase (short-subunit alcohol dehydrogenase family)